MTAAVVAARFRDDQDGRARLVGSTCRRCGATSFPAQPSCTRCTSTDVAERLLARQGRLWTWTVQAFPPKAPPYAGVVEGFEPFCVGYVELPGEVIVEGHLVDVDADALSIGDEMELVVWPFPRADGTAVPTHGFTVRR
ncbi:MAG: Zn-ribbon domain-containing OB-fold protein [Acidimicrobiia bacterium]